MNSFPDLHSLIDHTLLKPEATSAEIALLCEEALEHRFWSVCVNSSRVRQAAEMLSGSRVKVCTVAGFPLGASLSSIKAREAVLSMENGAHEIDMVINVGAIKDKEWKAVEEDVRAVASALQGGALLKVILETALLSREEIVSACQACETAGAQFVKTSTGFAAAGGASTEAVRLMRESVSEQIGVKASGGIRNRAAALAMVQAGATRLGTSASVRIVSPDTQAHSDDSSDY